MPKAKKPYDPGERYRGAVVGRMLVLEFGYLELADRMGISIPTARKYIRDPGTMTLDQMRSMNRALDITAAEARELLSYK